MNLTEFLAAAPKAIRIDATDVVFTVDDYTLFLNRAIHRYSDAKPLRVRASLTLVADQAAYDRPDGLIAFRESEWGVSNRRYGPTVRPPPWMVSVYPANLAPNMPVSSQIALGNITAPSYELPAFRLAGTQIYIDPAPTTEQIGSYGVAYNYWYDGHHVVDANGSTIPTHDDELILKMAQYEACCSLAGRADQSDLFMKRYREQAELINKDLIDLLSSQKTVTLIR
jgi:hypothetical protein